MIRVNSQCSKFGGEGLGSTSRVVGVSTGVGRLSECVLGSSPFQLGLLVTDRQQVSKVVIPAEPRGGLIEEEVVPNAELNANFGDRVMAAIIGGQPLVLAVN